MFFLATFSNPLLGESLLPRLHLFELHEQKWCPNVIRSGVTDGLYTAWKVLFWKNTLPHIRDLIAHAENPSIVDLCSGSGGPLPLVIEELTKENRNIQCTLTDLFPNRDWSSPNEELSLRYWQESVDAKKVPPTIGSARTLFEAFHHFRPAAAESILHDAVRNKQPIAIFEFQRRSFIDAILPPISLVVFVASFFNFWHTPFRWSKLIFTIIPIIPFILLFDGIVSVFRTYTPNELATMARQAGTENYRWEVRQTKDRGMKRITCLIGWPSEQGGVEMCT